MVFFQQAGRALSGLGHALFRTKRQYRPSGEPSDLSTCLSTLDLISLGIGSILGAGVYVVAGQVAKNIAGPAVILSFTIAAIASLLSGLCYAEFGARVPKTTGSAYAYSYKTVGEFIAFVIGWNLVLEYMIGTAADARALSGGLDFLTGNKIQYWTLEHIGRVPTLGSYPDFLGFFVTILVTAVLAIGVKSSAVYTLVFNTLNICLVVFIIILGLFHLNFDNWKGTPGFFPYGAEGVLSGAASCFYAFVGFDIIATTGEEARTPSKSIPIAIVVTLVSCYLAYVGVSAVISLIVPVSTLVSSAPLAEAFGAIGVHWAKYVIGSGAVFGLASSLLGSMFPLPRIIYAMASDGLFFKCFSKVNERTETPILATIVPGVMTAFFTMLFDLHELVEMMSIGTLLAYTLVCTSVLILRYQPDETKIMDTCLTPKRSPRRRPRPKLDVKEILKSDMFSIKATIQRAPDKPSGSTAATNGLAASPNGSGAHYDPTCEDVDDSSESSLSDNENQNLIEKEDSSDPDIDAIVNEYRGKVKISPKRHDRKSTTKYPGPTSTTGRRVSVATFVISCLFLVFSLIVTYAIDALKGRNPIAVSSMIVVSMFIMALAVFIGLQPQDRKGAAKLSFKVPLVPWLPLVTIFVNIYLMIKLSRVTWIRFIVWMSVGVLIYFIYGIRNSTEARPYPLSEEERVLLDPIPPPEMTQRLVRSHREDHKDEEAGSLLAQNIRG
ncbi:cationic amino acid transporter 3-like [Lineus longissimus]|uniref:cationic amino acid transporter 3-like n=1 Tax=Lineus longissimus TaxID=88925 RepID=UPI002B4D9EFD